MQISALMFVLLLVFGAVLGAFGFRVRGGLLGDRWKLPGQVSRLLYGAIMAVVIIVAGWPWPFGLLHVVGFWVLLTLAWFAGAVICGTFQAIDAGRNEGTRWGDFGRNVARGAIYAIPPAALLVAVALAFGERDRVWSALLLPVFGTLQGICYEAAHRFWPMPRHKPTEIAEFAVGAALGVGSVLAVLA